jgi:hypothetical protein
MSKIIDIKNTVLEFLKENINSTDVTVIKIEKNDETWKVVAEVYEDDSFLKSMNLPPKQKRVFYLVKLDADLEITSFERLDSLDQLDTEN